ncbi:hypothetical protein Maes01_00122 [Microbulbifer aestuariivivens]|uniref:Exonuclease domain-containing protein n=1 Tax=Microbulbifer aestuariivivens TaxID=1908308 RepID=A0ABP9WKF3_9GAMM
MQHLLIVDLEATCWDDRPQTVQEMEVIEFGCAHASTHGVVSRTFSQLVRPVFNPEISEFCQSLTGITQGMVGEAPDYPEAVRRLDAITAELEIDAWASWGQYDRNQIAVELERHGIAPAFFTAPHINLKALWQDRKGSKRRAGLGSALRSLGMQFEGRQHRGEDDAKNIARILPYLDL